jgi:hypothetical protein
MKQMTCVVFFFNFYFISAMFAVLKIFVMLTMLPLFCLLMATVLVTLRIFIGNHAASKQQC